jgi:tripartite-type tricarboxylate transporter receptor subunit TctC
VNGAIYDLPYNTQKDFEPVGLLASSPPVVVAKATMPAKDLAELIAWLKANPDKATQGTVGAGSPPHVAGVFFQTLTGTRFRFVPYRGVAPAMQDMLAGQIDFMIDSIANSLPQLRAGRVKIYAVMSKTRLAAAPDIPSADEAGLPGFHLSVWNALWAPKGLPKDVLARLSAAVVDALGDPAVRRRYADLGLDVPAREQQTPEALGALQKAEVEKWWPIIKAANIKAE